MTEVGLEPTPSKLTNLKPALSQHIRSIGHRASMFCRQLHGKWYMIPCAGVQNAENNTLYRNVNKMTGVGIEPTIPE